MKHHGITKHGRKTPNTAGQIKFTTASNPDDPELRQSRAYVQLTTTVVRKPFEDALVALLVICQLALSLVVNDLFYEFLKVVFPKVNDVLPKCGNTIRLQTEKSPKRLFIFVFTNLACDACQPPTGAVIRLTDPDSP